MDMDEVKMGEWVCKDLDMLRRIRTMGLDTKEKILKATTRDVRGADRRKQEPCPR